MRKLVRQMEVADMLNAREEELLKTDSVREMIALRAYRLYELRGYQDGFDVEDWLRAEQEVVSQSDLQNISVQAAVA